VLPNSHLRILALALHRLLKSRGGEKGTQTFSDAQRGSFLGVPRA